MKSLSTFSVQLDLAATSFNLSSLQNWGGQVEAPCGETAWAMTQQFSLLYSSLSVKSENSSDILLIVQYLRYSARTSGPVRWLLSR